MNLEDDQRKRRFDPTPEPSANLAATGGRPFVVPKHAVSHLHSKFRVDPWNTILTLGFTQELGNFRNSSLRRSVMQIKYSTIGIVPRERMGGAGVVGKRGRSVVNSWSRPRVIAESPLRQSLRESIPETCHF